MSFDIRGFPQRRGGPPDLPWDRILVVVPVVLLGIIALVLLMQSWYTVQAHEKAVVLRFGKYSRTASPGLHFCIPLVEEVWKVSVEEHSLRLPFGSTAVRPSESGEESTLMLTADLNAATVEWTVQWQVTEPEAFLFRIYREGDPAYAERIIMTVAQTVMNRLVGDYSIDEILTEKRGEIAELARQSTQAILDQYQGGVAIRDLQMQRVGPPEKVRPAFEQVNASIQRRDQLENEANKRRNEMLPKAYAEKDKSIREAEGYADRRRAESAGEIKALLAKYHAYQKAPEVTRQRLYLEAMQEVLTGVGAKLIIDSEINQRLLPVLPLEAGAKAEGAMP
jgi:membrane protease subunit HflK